MNLRIKQAVFSTFNPKFTVAFLKVENLDNSKLKETNHLLLEAEKITKLAFTKETPKTHHLIAPWALAQLEFGPQAKHYQTSVEKLIKQVLKKKVKASNSLSAILSYLALKHLIPFGADDLGKLQGTVTYDIASGKEKIDALRKVKKGALYYHDANQVLGTKLDAWSNRKTKLTKQSTAALIHFSAIPPVTKVKLNALVKETTSLIQTFCGGKVRVVFLNKKKSSTKV